MRAYPLHLRLTRRVRQWWADVEVDAYHRAFELGWPGDTWRYQIPMVLLHRAVYALRTLVARPVCWIKGHDVTLDEGGPNNPYVDAACERCGFAWPRRWW